MKSFLLLPIVVFLLSAFSLSVWSQTDALKDSPGVPDVPGVPIVEPDRYAPSEFAIVPERRIDDIYPNCASETAAQLKRVKALKIDIPLAKRDFPFMVNWDAKRIYKWFEKMAGLVSVQQTQQEVVNTKIETTGNFVKVYRPPGYGRAFIVMFKEGDFEGGFEVKMSGVGPGHLPSQQAHGNGLGTLGEVIREDQFENAERAAIAQRAPFAGSADSAKLSIGGTVAGYGVMYAGYDVRHSDGNTSPAGIYIRQLHKRMTYKEKDDDIRSAWLPAQAKDEILKQISRSGFYTGWESNIQGLLKDNKVYVFDFGHWIAWQGRVAEANVWVDPNLAVDFSRWGWSPENGPRRDQDQWRTSKLDNAWNWAHDVAKKATDPNGQRYFIQHYNNMLMPLFEKLKVGVAPAVGLSCRRAFGN